MPGAATIDQVLRARARLEPDAVAVRDFDRSLTNRQWNERSCRLANALAGLGLKKGDRVAVLAHNRIEWAEIYLAVAKSGLVAVPVNFRLTGSEITYLLSDVEASALIVESSLWGVVEEVRDQLPIPEGRYILIGKGEADGEYRHYEDLISEAADREPAESVAPDDAWCIIYTSGTTGKPKGAIRDHGSTVRLALMTGTELSIVRNDDALLVMPLCHANSIYFFASFLYCGAKLSIFSRNSFDPDLCLNAISEHGHTFTSLVPTHYTMLLDARQTASGSSDYGRISKLMISSAPARAQLKSAVMEMFPNSGLFELYGSTEAGWVTMLHPHEQFQKLGSVGREVVGSQPIMLVDDAGHEVADGEPGELFSAGPCNFAGYWRQPDKTAEAFSGDHLSVGDMAVRDGDGYIRLVDRKNNLIISGGENVYPSEVETVRWRRIPRSVTWPLSASRMTNGENLYMQWWSRAPARSLSSDDLIVWAKERLAGYKRPRHVTFIKSDDMPRNATGKILHRALREQLSRQDDDRSFTPLRENRC